MFFRGLFLSFISFAAIIGVTSLISSAELRFSSLIRPFLPFIGMFLLFIALWSRHLAVTVFFCSAAFTFFYASHRLKRVGRCRSSIYRRK